MLQLPSAKLLLSQSHCPINTKLERVIPTLWPPHPLLHLSADKEGSLRKCLA